MSTWADNAPIMHFYGPQPPDPDRSPSTKIVQYSSAKTSWYASQCASRYASYLVDVKLNWQPAVGFSSWRDNCKFYWGGILSWGDPNEDGKCSFHRGDDLAKKGVDAFSHETLQRISLSSSCWMSEFAW